MEEHNCIIPINGGPLCGESLTAKDGRIPNSVPLFFENKFYLYDLFIESSGDWTNISYEYSNQTMEINEDRRKSN